jgi:hypothetical protein
MWRRSSQLKTHETKKRRKKKKRRRKRKQDRQTEIERERCFSKKCSLYYYRIKGERHSLLFF